MIKIINRHILDGSMVGLNVGGYKWCLWRNVVGAFDGCLLGDVDVSWSVIRSAMGNDVGCDIDGEIDGSYVGISVGKSVLYYNN